MDTRSNTVRLLISCPDASGLVARITGFVAQHGGNILDLDQHTDPDERMFFARVVIELNGFTLTADNFADRWGEVAAKHDMTWSIHFGSNVRRVAILVGKMDHCIRELLWRWDDGELPCDIPLVVSNHADVEAMVTRHGPEFAHLPVTTTTKDSQEARILELLDRHKIDLVVLARYMRILSPEFVASMPNRIINIHHSFLPAFAGARPYHQAYAAGVKIIGATCHYVTAELDAGPIIEQAIARVNHRDTVDSLVRKGKDLERSALLTGVQLHLEDRVIVHQNRTIVFD
jgi:formyltetrahydrofolate deformylase